MWGRIVLLLFLFRFSCYEAQTYVTDLRQIDHIAPTGSIQILDVSDLDFMLTIYGFTLISYTSAVIHCQYGVFITAESITISGITFQDCPNLFLTYGNNTIINSHFIGFYEHGINAVIQSQQQQPEIHAFILNCSFTGGTFGAILLPSNPKSTVLCQHSTFSGNVAGIYGTLTGGLTVDQSSFSANGLAISLTGSGVGIVTKTTFSQNVQSIRIVSGSLNVRDCTFSNSNNGQYTEVMHIESNSVVTIAGSNFYSNNLVACNIVSSFVKVSDSQFSYNHGSTSGAFHVNSGQLQIFNCEIQGNSGSHAGGIRFYNSYNSLVYDSSGTDSAGGILIQNSQVEVHNSRLSGNSAPSGTNSQIAVFPSLQSDINGGIYVANDARLAIRNSELINSQLSFCCGTQITNPNSRTCSFPACTHCMETSGCSCPFSSSSVTFPVLPSNTTCTCSPGFTIGGQYQCTDLNECTSGLHNCDPNANCTNTYGSFECKCKSGYDGAGIVCADIDECADINTCHSNATCTNLAGGFSCTCQSGFSGNGVGPTGCVAICTGTTCSSLVSCTNIEDGFNCSPCPSGYSGDGYGTNGCSDIDECSSSASNNCSELASCFNKEGTYNCECYYGYDGDGFDCTDTNECELNLHNCSVNANCTNTEGSFSCTCKSGYDGSGTFCEDIDECTNHDICHINATCTNFGGGFNCSSCPSGYVGSGYGINGCSDVDECSSSTSNNCSNLATCINEEGTYNCECNYGFSGNGFNCTDTNECVLNLHNCSENATCTNTKGSFSCSCKSGYDGNGTFCEDIDECADSDTCHINATCTNLAGSFNCLCPFGFSGNGVGADGCSEICTNLTCSFLVNCANIDGGGFNCSSCPYGYVGNGYGVNGCLDFDECSSHESNNCSDYATCLNKEGSYNCSCDTGFHGDGFNCSDINECALNLHNCNENANCANTHGSFSCSCDSGYNGNGTFCEDVDECADHDTCHLNATCTNLAGTFSCLCPFGFIGEGSGTHGCTEICTNTTCSFLVNCMNIDSGFNCSSCPSGYIGSGYGINGCSDFDECSHSASNNCSDFATCFNKEGSYNCSCFSGFYGNGFDCTDTNECELDLHNCSNNAICTNTNGSFLCSCKSGYDGNGTFCEDVDECIDLDPCHINATCTNLAGSFNCLCPYGSIGDGVGADGCSNICTNTTCSFLVNCTDIDNGGGFYCDQCPSGYVGDGYRIDGCSDFDECSDHASSNCSEFATCFNKEGSYNCTCNSGFYGDGYECTDINECALNIHNCSENANCTNINESFNCTCHDGFQGNGINCSDINECEVNSSICPDSITCFNLQGSFACCLPGFSFINSSCIDINECELQHPLCSDLETCFNTQGSYSCCSRGHTLHNNLCKDINECEITPPVCSDSLCFNIIGSHICCPAGFILSNLSCIDIDECSHYNSICPESTTCFNTNGSHSCCPMGFTLFNSSCIDIDECNLNSSVCSESTTCFNTPGSYNCCPSGFTLEDKSCTDINECELSSVCGDSMACINTLGSYACCPLGFTLVNSLCVDTNCSVNNGGCAYHVRCTNTNEGRLCDNCPFGYTGSGYSSCHGLCGNGTCDSELLENFVSCPFDCREEGDACGDQRCTSSETCSSCPEDCGRCAPNLCPFCVHGQCKNGVCVCYSHWRGPTCYDLAEEIVVVTNTTIPSAVVQPSTYREVAFEVSITKMIEKDAKNQEVKSLSMVGFNYSHQQINLTNSSNIMWEYYTLLGNGAAVNMTFIQFKEDLTNHSFYNDTTTFPGNTLKLSCRVANWPFSSILNTLHVQMDISVLSADSANSCIDSGVISEGSQKYVKWLSISVDQVDFYAQFSTLLVVDGRKRTTQFEYDGSQTVYAVLPHFWEFAEFDPDYSLLVNPERINRESCNNVVVHKKINIRFTVGISVGLTFGIALIVGSILLVRKRKKKARLLVKLKTLQQYKTNH